MNKKGRGYPRPFAVKFQFGGESPLTIRTGCIWCRYFPDPPGNDTASFKFQFIALPLAANAKFKMQNAE